MCHLSVCAWMFWNTHLYILMSWYSVAFKLIIWETDFTKALVTWRKEHTMLLLVNVPAGILLPLMGRSSIPAQPHCHFRLLRLSPGHHDLWESWSLFDFDLPVDEHCQDFMYSLPLEKRLSSCPKSNWWSYNLQCRHQESPEQGYSALDRGENVHLPHP